MTSHKPKATSHPPTNRSEVLRASLQSLAQQRELRDQQRPSQMNTSSRKGLHSERRKANIIMKVQAWMNMLEHMRNTLYSINAGAIWVKTHKAHCVSLCVRGENQVIT